MEIEYILLGVFVEKLVHIDVILLFTKPSQNANKFSGLAN